MKRISGIHISENNKITAIMVFPDMPKTVATIKPVKIMVTIEINVI